MVSIDTIKQQILQLDAGSFQSMCDSFLSKSGYPSIVSLGTQAGTRKTTLGTPDTYFYDANGKYVFVEYTTQQRRIVDKIKEDIRKCLDVSVTHIPHDKIAEIIYCHTSSNIAPKDDAAFRAMCEAVNVRFSIYGIDRLAQELYLKHRGIVKEYLNIAIDTNQIESIGNFVKHYDALKIAAPLNTRFLFREDELTEINRFFERTDIVILTGPAGAGKTRLALEYAETYSEASGSQLLCIHDNALPIYDDLVLYMEMPKRYMLVIDDANQLSGLRHVVNYVTRRNEGYEVKILITVRDYAISNVKNEISQIASFEILSIALLADEQIRQLVEQELGVRNEHYLERIVHLAEGNARIAMLAGKLACDVKRLDSINDITQLYAEYYESALDESGLHKDRQLLVTAGLVAFLRTLNLDHIDPLESILTQCRLTKETFIEKIFALHKLEIVDICNDKAVRFAEQCLANYVLKYVFCDEKLVSLRDMIYACFRSCREKTVVAINTLAGVYRVAELHEFIGREIRAVWERLAAEKDPYFFEYVKAFYLLNPIEALIIMRDIVRNEDNVYIPIEKLDTKVDKSINTISHDVLAILRGFANAEEVDSALDLIFMLYQKRHDLFAQCCQTITNYYSLSERSCRCEYITQIKLMERFKEYACDRTNDHIIALFLTVVPEFLKLQGEGVKEGRKNTATWYHFPLTLTEGVTKYRRIMWETLVLLCAEDKYQRSIYDLLNGYGHAIGEKNRAVIDSDMPYIVSIMRTAFSEENLPNCLLAEKLTNIFSTDEKPFDSFSAYLSNRKLRLYRLLKGPEHSLVRPYGEWEQARKDAIEKYVSRCAIDELNELIDICKECEEYDDSDNYKISHGLRIAFVMFSVKGSAFVEVVKYYIKSDTPLNLDPLTVLKELFRHREANEVFELINSEVYANKNSWLYAYYHELPNDSIDKMQMQGLYSFLRDESDAALTSSSYRDVDFLERYCREDADVLVKASRIILSKVSYSRFIPQLYFSLLFNRYHNSPEDVVKKYENDLELLEDIYIELISCSHYTDHDGSFLKEIYRVSPSILDKFIKHILCVSTRIGFVEYKEKCLVFFEMDNAKQIFDAMIDALAATTQGNVYVVSEFIATIIVPMQNDDELMMKQDQWIQYYITANANDVDKMRYLFFGIANLPDERKVDYITLLLENNESYSLFESLPLFPLIGRWTNSAVPHITTQIRYMQQILSRLSGLKFIEHKRRIENIIEELRDKIRQEEIRDILRN